MAPMALRGLERICHRGLLAMTVLTAPDSRNPVHKILRNRESCWTVLA